MKKILTWALFIGVILPLSFFITACSPANTNGEEPETEVETETEVDDEEDQSSEDGDE